MKNWGALGSPSIIIFLIGQFDSALGNTVLRMHIYRALRWPHLQASGVCIIQQISEVKSIIDPFMKSTVQYDTKYSI